MGGMNCEEEMGDGKCMMIIRKEKCEMGDDKCMKGGMEGMEKEGMNCCKDMKMKKDSIVIKK
jgi:hypothetical protein